MPSDEQAQPRTAIVGEVGGQLDEQEYRAVLRLLSEYVFRLSVMPDGTMAMTMASDRLVDATGRRIDDVRHQEDWARIVHPEDAARFFSIVRTVAAEGGRCEFEGRFRRESGGYRFIQVVAEGIRAPGSGRVESIVGAVADISERKQAEEHIRQTEKMAAIGQLAGRIAHDFNNQLTGILGFAELLRDRLDDPGLREYANTIATCAKRSAGLTRQLLAFARKGHFHLAAVDVRDILGEVAALVRQSVDERIVIQPLLPESPILGIADSAQLHHAVLNLALNACDAMPEGGTLSLACELVVLDQPTCASLGDVAPGRYVRVTVSDTGIGIGPELKQHLFEPFFTTKPAGKGTGLGLAAVYGIVRGHNGAIKVDSEPDQGATFAIFLPASEQRVLPATPKSPQTAHASAHVMVVDDDDMVLRFVTTALRERGYQVTPCQGGGEALALFTQNWRDIRLVILDMVMPGMDGPATLSAIRGVDPAVQVLLISGFVPTPPAHETGGPNAPVFLQKPLSVEALLDGVAQALRATP